MKEIVKVKEKYSVILENYRMNNSVLNYSYRPITKNCLLCGGAVLTSELTAHMQLHEIKPPSNLTYQLCLPFRVINDKIANGVQFVKLLSIVNNRGYSVPFNGLNLPDWQKLTDTNDCTVRYLAKKRKFIRTIW